MQASFIHADIFFFISTIALVLIAAGIVWALVYVIRILKNVSDISDKAKAEWTGIVEDAQKLRGVLREEGMKWRHVIGLVRAFFTRESATAAKKQKAKKAEFNESSK